MFMIGKMGSSILANKVGQQVMTRPTSIGDKRLFFWCLPHKYKAIKI